MCARSLSRRLRRPLLRWRGSLHRRRSPRQQQQPRPLACRHRPSRRLPLTWPRPRNDFPRRLLLQLWLRPQCLPLSTRLPSRRFPLRRRNMLSRWLNLQRLLQLRGRIRSRPPAHLNLLLLRSPRPPSASHPPCPPGPERRFRRGPYPCRHPPTHCLWVLMHSSLRLPLRVRPAKLQWSRNRNLFSPRWLRRRMCLGG
jgi:hypothetical protein